ncbi:MAG: hypothetical protein LBK82_15940 [Planctomycetaceae bacterium]|nr:hypothetical protein [Planctomycetaceae bacterium]
MTPKRKATPLTIVNLIHCRRVRRRNLSAKGCPPYGCLPYVYWRCGGNAVLGNCTGIKPEDLV